MINRKIINTTLAVVSAITAVIAVLVMIMMWVGIVTFRFNLMGLALTFIFAVFAHIIVRILCDDDSDESFEIKQ